MVTGSRLERKKYQASQQESTPLDSSENQGRQKKKGKKAGKKPLWRRILKYCLIAFFSLFILAVASGAAIFIYYSSSAPQITEADLVGQMPSKIYDQKGKSSLLVIPNAISLPTSSRSSTMAVRHVPSVDRKSVV